MADESKSIFPALYPPTILLGKEQRAYLHQQFDEFTRQLAACRQDESYRFVIKDLEAFRAFFTVNCEERIFLRELMAAKRIGVTCYLLPQGDDLFLTELWRRNFTYGVQCWEGLLGGVLDEETMVEAPLPAWREASEVGKTVTATLSWLLQAEKISPLTQLTGADYPEAEFERVWKQILYLLRGWSAAGLLEEGWYTDLVGVCQEASILAFEAWGKMHTGLTTQINTAAAKGAPKAISSMVIINTSGRAYSGPCHTLVYLREEHSPGFEIRDTQGRHIAYEVVSEGMAHGQRRYEIYFTVHALPAVGYHVYTVQPATRLSTRRIPYPENPAAVQILHDGLHPGPLPPKLVLLAAKDNAIACEVIKSSTDLPTAAPTEGSRISSMLLHLRETSGQPHTAALDFGRDVLGAWRVDALERPQGEVKFTRAGWRRPARVEVALGECDSVYVAVQLQTPLLERRPTPPLTSLISHTSTIYCRSWEHNLGADPNDALPLKVWLEGKLPRGRNTRFPIYLSNDSEDREFSGGVDLLAPEAWTLIPRRIPFRIPPRSQGLFEAMIIVPEDASPCFLRAETSYDDRTVYDVLPIGEVQPLQVTLSQQEGGVEITLINPNAGLVEGLVTLCLPLTHLSHALQPPLQYFRIEAGETQHLQALGKLESGTPVMAKVAWYGRVQYVWT